MNLLVVVLLAVLWASILVPGAFKGRQFRSPSASIDSFERSMGILASETRGRLTSSPPGRHILVVHDPARVVLPASSRARTLARRRMILQALLAATAVTGLLAVVLGGAAVSAFAVAAAALIGYVAVLAQIKAAADQARRTVRRLPRAAAAKGLAAAGAPADAAPLESPWAEDPSVDAPPLAADRGA
jgi:hypothetical protein